MMWFFVAALAAVAVMVFVIAMFMLYKEYAASSSLGNRLDRLTSGRTATVANGGAEGILREGFGGAEGGIARMLPEIPSLKRVFEQADYSLSIDKFWTLTGILALVGAAGPLFARLPLYVAPVMACIFGVLPLMHLLWTRKKRLKKFQVQLCEGMELVARALRAGHSLAAAMQTVAAEMPEPICSEFGRVYEEQNLGISIEDAMRSLADRVPNMDLKFFVTAVIIQRTTGGDLAEILDKIGHVIRERFKIQGMVQALTGEGRISGVVLIGLPISLFFLMLKMNYEYVQVLWTDERGQWMSIIGIALMILGAVVIRKIVQIKI